MRIEQTSQYRLDRTVTAGDGEYIRFLRKQGLQGDADFLRAGSLTVRRIGRRRESGRFGLPLFTNSTAEGITKQAHLYTVTVHAKAAANRSLPHTHV